MVVLSQVPHGRWSLIRRGIHPTQRRPRDCTNHEGEALLHLLLTVTQRLSMRDLVEEFCVLWVWPGTGLECGARGPEGWSPLLRGRWQQGYVFLALGFLLYFSLPFFLFCLTRRISFVSDAHRRGYACRRATSRALFR